jgi:hypothetical protein
MNEELNQTEENPEKRIESRNIALDAVMQLYSNGAMSFYNSNKISEELEEE